MREQIFVVDTSALYNFPGWLKRLSRALKKGELEGKEIKGQIVIPEPVLQNEVNEKYRKRNTLDKELSRKVRRAKSLLDKELSENNGIWRVQRITKEIMGAMMQLKKERKIYSVENPPNDNDLLIVATAMYLIQYRQRPNRITVLSWDGGVLNTLRHCGVSLKGGNPKDIFQSYWKWRRLKAKFGLIKDLKKGD